MLVTRAHSLYLGRRCSGLSYNQFWLDQNFARLFAGLLNSFDERASGKLAHIEQRLANRGEPGNVERCLLDVIETYDGDILGYSQPRIAEGADCANG